MKAPTTIAIALLASLLIPPVAAEAGEIVKRTYYNSKGEPVQRYVYQAGDSRRSFARSSDDGRYRAYRSSGYTHYPLRVYSTGFGSYRYSSSYRTCRPVRPAVQTTRTRITYNAARPIVIGGHRGGVVIRRR